jgi:hypothetical protein
VVDEANENNDVLVATEQLRGNASPDFVPDFFTRVSLWEKATT